MTGPNPRALLLAAGAALLGASAATAAPVIGTVTASPAGWNRTDQVDIAWSVAGAQPYLSGLRIEVNSAADGSGDGQWVTVATRVPLDAGSGVLAAVPLAGMQGTHAVRATAWDQTGSAVAFPAPLRLDLTPPVVNRTAPSARTPTSVTLAWNQGDAHSGLAVGESWLEVAARADGVFDASAVRIPTDAVAGSRSATIDLAGAADGERSIRLRLADLAGNVTLTPMPPLFVDHGAPTVSDTAIMQWPTPIRPAAQIDYTAGDSLSGVPVGASMSVIDLATGAVLTRGATGPGRQSVFVDLPDPSPRRVAIVVHDAVGNAGQSTPVLIDATSAAAQTVLYGAASVRDPRAAQLADAVLTTRAPGVRLLAGRAGGPPAAIVPFGGRIALEGSLSSPRGPIGGMELEAWDRQGRVIATGATAPDGTFRLSARPVAGGPIRIGVPVADQLLPAAPPSLAVRIHPRLVLRTSRRTARAGGPAVVFTGTVAPTPSLLGIAAKNVVVEWRDPLRGIWRPMVNTRVGPAGRLRTSWRFNAGGFRVPVRLRLPAEPGWPTDAGVSRAVTIVVK